MVRETALRGRIWIVSELYYPEDTSTGYFVTGIAEGLAGTFETAVIASQPTYAARGTRAPRRESRNGVAVHRVRSTRLNPHILPFRIMNALTITASVFFNLMWRLRRRDVAIVVTNPPTLPLVVRIVCRLRGARCVLLVHDVYPEVLSASGILPRTAPLYRQVDRFSRILYRGFDRIVTIGRDMQALVAAKTGDDLANVPIITNWGDPVGIAPRSGPNPLLERYGLSGKFVVQYGGNIGRTHGVDALIAVAQALAGDPSIHFLVIGEGARKRDLEKRVADLAIPNVTILSTVPRAELAVSLAACDVALITFLPGMKGVSVPSRMYNILAAGKPIIAMAEEGSELALVVREERAGWVIPPNDTAALIRTIGEAKLRQEERQAMGQRGRDAVTRRYHHGRVVEDWKNLVAPFIDDE